MKTFLRSSIADYIAVQFAWWVVFDAQCFTGTVYANVKSRKCPSIWWRGFFVDCNSFEVEAQIPLDTTRHAIHFGPSRFASKNTSKCDKDVCVKQSRTDTACVRLFILRAFCTFRAHNTKLVQAITIASSSEQARHVTSQNDTTSRFVSSQVVFCRWKWYAKVWFRCTAFAVFYTRLCETYSWCARFNSVV